VIKTIINNNFKYIRTYVRASDVGTIRTSMQAGVGLPERRTVRQATSCLKTKQKNNPIILYHCTFFLKKLFYVIVNEE